MCIDELQIQSSADFYPRSPCGERRDASDECPVYYFISIHALLAESDAERKQRHDSLSTFLSTLSLRRATVCGRLFCYAFFNFYPRSPCGERHANIVFERVC